MQPTEGAFNELATLSKSVFLVAALRDSWFDTEPTQSSTQVLGIERLVGHERCRFLLGTPGLAAHCGDFDNQGK